MSRRRVVLGVCAIGVGSLLLSGCNGFRTSSQSFTDDAAVQQKVTSVRIENGSGAVRIRMGQQPNVRRTVYYASDKPDQTVSYEGETLVLRDCAKRNCSIDYDVMLPVGAKVVGEVGSGEIEVVGMSEVGVRAGSGDVRVRDVPGPVTVKVNSGQAELSGLGQSAVVEASSGDVRLTNIKGDVTVLSRSGEVVALGIEGKTSVENSSGDVRIQMVTAQAVKAHASSGNIDLTVPRGQPYRVDARTSSGDRSVEIATDPAGQTLLDLDASSGDIKVAYS
jgi:hypothetical protein